MENDCSLIYLVYRLNNIYCRFRQSLKTFVRIVGPRRIGRPRQSWLRTVEADLPPMNLGLAAANCEATRSGPIGLAETSGNGYVVTDTLLKRGGMAGAVRTTFIAPPRNQALGDGGTGHVRRAPKNSGKYFFGHLSYKIRECC